MFACRRAAYRRPSDGEIRKTWMKSRTHLHIVAKGFSNKTQDDMELKKS